MLGAGDGVTCVRRPPPVLAEKLSRWLDDRSHSKEALVDKLKVKCSTLKSKCTKLEAALAQKEEVGEVLHAIDFDQLTIENQQFLEKIEERNNELLRLKLTSARTAAALARLRKKLGMLARTRAMLAQEAEVRKGAIEKFEIELAPVMAAKMTEEKAVRALRSQAEESELPQALEYIRLSHRVSQLSASVSDWSRKVEIAGMEAKRQRQMHRSGGLSRGTLGASHASIAL
eukprot:jgi/Chlat1/1909/Chrsp149S00118